MLKKSHGNMYDWVTHVHSHLAGECSHKCPYCYVGKSRGGRPAKYTGPTRLIEDELRVNYGSGRIIFVEHMNDLFAADVSAHDILKILDHMGRFPGNKYVLQSKAPRRVEHFIEKLPKDVLFGTTIETNRDIHDGNAPQPWERFSGMKGLKNGRVPRFVTIEPIMDFDPDTLAGWLEAIDPVFIAIGADSKGCGLKEPTADKIRDLIYRINILKIPIRRKTNLGRLLGE
jgi:DNA repair photolyase